MKVQVGCVLGLCLLSGCLLETDAWLFGGSGGKSGDSQCTDIGGSCKTSGCKGSWRTGLCSGPTNRRCCVSNNGGSSGDRQCANIGGTCKTSGCSGSWRTGLCAGPTNRRCCVKGSGGSGGSGVAKLSHSKAKSMLANAGIGIVSSGGCSNRNVRTCTSLEQINRKTITGTINELKKPSGCPITVTGGTEIGHAAGTYSHWNGYKIDLGLNSCLDRYITRTFPFYRMRGSYKVYRAPSGNEYCLEGNHWDNTYY